MRASCSCNLPTRRSSACKSPAGAQHARRSDRERQATRAKRRAPSDARQAACPAGGERRAGGAGIRGVRNSPR
eukprot:3127877-Prymnesium_polylepis.1